MTTTTASTTTTSTTRAPKPGLGRSPRQVELIETGMVVPARVLRELRWTVADLERWLRGHVGLSVLASLDSYFGLAGDALTGERVKDILADHHRELTDLLVNGETA